MPALRLDQLAIGDRVQHELMVRARDRKTAKNGNPFEILTLGNSSGEITTTIWAEGLPALEGVRAGHIVQVIGEVSEYRGRRQLELSAPLRVLHGAAVDLSDFLPTTAVDPLSLWDKIDKWRAAMPTTLRSAVDLFFADDAFRAEFERTPGAPRGHHAQLGGLILHTVEVANIARHAAQTMRGNVDLITAGALLHDIGKVRAYTISAAGFEQSTEGRLLGHIVLGSLMLESRFATQPASTWTEAQRLELHHFIQSHHGIPEYGAAVRPMTLEAELLHYADQSSAKGNDFAEAVVDRELFPTGEEAFAVRNSWRLERRVWKRDHSWT
jgi:3'-5' exoribonuclease